MSWCVEHADCLDAMRAMDEASVDAICTDPPYGLEFMGKEWDRLGDVGKTSHAGPSERDGSTVFGRQRVAFSGSSNRKCGKCRKWEWDYPDRKCVCDVPDFPNIRAHQARIMQEWHQAWATEALRVLKPGGHLLAFGGTRTYHRLACAVEDAGFEIRDSVIWLYGSGFPKSHNVSAAIDKANGHPNRGRAIPTASTYQACDTEQENKLTSNPVDPYEAKTPEAEAWNGWGTALKPSHEPVVVAQKPASERDILAWIGSRLDRLEAWLAQEADPTTPTGEAGGSSDRTAMSPSESMDATFSNTVTSWRSCWAELWTAANTSITSTATRPTTDLRTLQSCLSGITPENTTPDLMQTDGWRSRVSAVDNLFAAAVLSLRGTLALSADGPATSSTRTNSPDAGASHEPIVVARKPLIGTVAQNVLEHGTGALNVDGCRIEGAYESNEGGDPVMDNTVYGKGLGVGQGAHSAGRWPANVTLSPEAAAELDRQSGERVSGSRAEGVRSGMGYHGADGDGGPAIEGSRGGSSRFFYTAKASRAERNAGLDGFPESNKRWNAGPLQEHGIETGTGRIIERLPRANHHPTVKPIDLMRWLVRLVTPPDGTCLDPFAGSGTTGIAAVLEGFDFIGIEREAEYVEIARARIEWWAQHQGREADEVLAVSRRSERMREELGDQEALF